MENGQHLLESGARRYGGKPFRVITTLGERIILPKECIAWVEKHPDLDHQAQVSEVSLELRDSRNWHMSNK